MCASVCKCARACVCIYFNKHHILYIVVNVTVSNMQIIIQLAAGLVTFGLSIG